MTTLLLIWPRKSVIAYCPLNLPKLDVDEDIVNSLIDYYNPGHHDNIWETLPLLGRVNSQEDFLSAVEFEKAWEKRYNVDGEIIKNLLLTTILKPIYNHFDLLPLTITHAQILRATRDIPKHHDMKHSRGKFINDLNADMYEPNGWKIILNNTSEKSFYMSKTWDSKIDYIQLPKDTNTFVINEQTYQHGSTFVKDKCVISIFGLVDKDKANKLIDESKKKYSNYIIEY